MLDVLQFVLSGFWVFIGTWILIGSVCFGIARIILAFKGTAIVSDSQKAVSARRKIT